MTSIDIDWNRAGWQSTLSAMTTLLRAERLPFGIIYNSVARKATTNEEWLRAAQDHFAEIEGKMHIVPDKAVFDSWDRPPIRAFSDDTGLGEDYLVKEYVAMHHR